MTAWYDRAFGPWYLRLYPHRDGAEAERAVEALSGWLPPGGALLDVGCGPGRHLQALAARGRDVFGLDRSRALLAEIDPAGPLRGRVVRGDMRRLPFGDARFRTILSMFTSFGYFESRDAHRALLVEFARVTATGGRFLLDYLNAPAVRARLEPRSRREVDGYRVEERRAIEPRGEAEAVVKRVEVRDGSGAVVESYAEEVALYDRKVVEGLLAESGWQVQDVFGAYDGSSWSPESDRLLLVSERGGRS